jgi:hypothetical protein
MDADMEGMRNAMKEWAVDLCMSEPVRGRCTAFEFLNADKTWHSSEFYHNQHLQTRQIVNTAAFCSPMAELVKPSLQRKNINYGVS